MNGNNAKNMLKIIIIKGLNKILKKKMPTKTIQTPQRQKTKKLQCSTKQ